MREPNSNIYNHLLHSNLSSKSDKGIICTTEYRMLTISIKDTASKPVILSNYLLKKQALVRSSFQSELYSI